MKVKELISLLQQQDQEKEVMIQQGEDFDYMAVYSVRVQECINMDENEEDEFISAVVIEYS